MNTAGYLVLPIVPGGYARDVTTKTVVIQTMQGPIQCCPYSSVKPELKGICRRASAILADDSDSGSSNNTDFANPFGLASWLHFVLARCHPFNDGNGRTTRMVASIPLMRAGYPPIAINLSQRAGYLSAINKAYDGDFKPLANCICEGMKDTIKSVREVMAA
ncbi:hypothetical protein BDZ89DRAFT_1068630 [Hymenopellis radicata]|nr:hypothetical protein BDZ89DRAFT_1068630 [Hymenopellis radicata]